jgi:hypothetical protein
MVIDHVLVALDALLEDDTAVPDLWVILLTVASRRPPAIPESTDMNRVQTWHSDRSVAPMTRHLTSPERALCHRTRAITGSSYILGGSTLTIGYEAMHRTRTVVHVLPDRGSMMETRTKGVGHR